MAEALRGGVGSGIAARIVALCGALMLLGCAAPPEPAEPVAARIASLAADIQALSTDIDPAEARRAAQVAITYPLQLRADYGVTDPPLVHNVKVNSGLRPRGLCYHWADDLEQRLSQEAFVTLDLHRAIGNTDSIRIEHSTVLVSAVGQPWDHSLVLDPWRNGGPLFWAPPNEDVRYGWKERSRVFADRR